MSLGNCRVSRLGGRGRGFEVEVEVKKSRSRLKSRGRGFEVEAEVLKSRSRLKSRGRGFEVEVEVKKSRSRLKSRGRGFKKSRLKGRKNYVNYSFTNIFPLCILQAFTCLLLFLSTTIFMERSFSCSI